MFWISMIELDRAHHGMLVATQRDRTPRSHVQYI